MSVPSQAEIEAVWEKHGVQRTGQDMSNECRLAARIIAMEQERGLTLAALIDESYGTAKEKGWHEEDKPVTVGDRLMLMVTELAEAMEEHRRNIPLGRIYFNHPTAGKCDYSDDLLPSWKPEGFVVELADTIIRICDMAGKHELPLERALRLKLRFNKTREHRHGGKAI